MKKIRMPTAYTILFLLLVLVAAATWIIPAGAYEDRKSTRLNSSH